MKADKVDNVSKIIYDNNVVCFDDVLIVPSDVTKIESRRKIDLSSSIFSVDKQHELICQYPLMSSPMDTVTGPLMASTLAEMKIISYLHRYNTIEEQLVLYKEAVSQTNNPEYVGIAIGALHEDYERLSTLYKAGCRSFCIDIANGHMSKLHDFIKNIESKFSDSFIITGNTATGAAFGPLEILNISGVRVGIGGGAGCTTRIKTGVGLPTLFSLMETASAKSYDTTTKIIADGGIRNSGDAAKSLMFADFIMLGSLLAACNESPGETYEKNGKIYKQYRGMASKEAQKERPNSKKILASEGASGLVESSGSVQEFIEEFFLGVASSLSYSNSSNLTEFREKSRLAVVSSASIQESKPRLK